MKNEDRRLKLGLVFLEQDIDGKIKRAFELTTKNPTPEELEALCFQCAHQMLVELNRFSHTKTVKMSFSKRLDLFLSSLFVLNCIRVVLIMLLVFFLQYTLLIKS